MRCWEHRQADENRPSRAPLPPIRSAYPEIQETANAFLEMKTAVERSHRKYQGIFNNIQDVYYEASLNGTLIEISPSIEKISQYRREELIGKTLLKIYADPDQRGRSCEDPQRERAHQ